VGTPTGRASVTRVNAAVDIRFGSVVVCYSPSAKKEFDLMLQGLLEYWTSSLTTKSKESLAQDELCPNIKKQQRALGFETIWTYKSMFSYGLSIRYLYDSEAWLAGKEV